MAARPEHSMMRCADLSRPEYSTLFPPETAEVTLAPNRQLERVAEAIMGL